MRTTTFSDARQNFAKLLDSVTEDREEVVVTRSGHEPVVIVSMAEWQSIAETLYLMRSPANARRLSEAIARFRRGEPGHMATMAELDALAEGE